MVKQQLTVCYLMQTKSKNIMFISAYTQFLIFQTPTISKQKFPLKVSGNFLGILHTLAAINSFMVLLSYFCIQNQN